MNTPNLTQLKQALAIAEKIESLQAELASIVGGSSVSSLPASLAAPAKQKGGMSAAGRARIAAAQKARWAKVKGATPTPAPTPAKAAVGKGTGRRNISPEARAKMAAAAKARWAKVNGAKAAKPAAKKAPAAAAKATKMSAAHKAKLAAAAKARWARIRAGKEKSPFKK
ncbi:MAG: hypothetical protein K8R23_13900 [Chthoniobacter sp.]|nr:hypothetical protein [Chthoniobacter sp.]